MFKKHLFLIFSLILSICLFNNFAIAASNDIWVFKSKDNPPFVIWMSGLITRGDPNASTVNSEDDINLSADKYFYANRWFKNGSAMYCPWGNKPIIYQIDSKGGNYKIGLSVKNFASKDPKWTKPDGYDNFYVYVYVNDKRVGSLKIPASDTEVKTVYLDKAVNIKAGSQKVKFVWTNDKYYPGKKQDANIEIHNVHLKK